MTETIPEDLVSEAPDPLAPDDAAPYGYTVDRVTGERRAKKVPGRPKAADGDSPVSPGQGDSPPVESLAKVSRETDRTPVSPRRTHGFRAKRGGPRTDRTPKESPDVPPFRAGPIAKGMNRLYAKTGKLIKVMDPEVGNAIISVTKKESDDDLTVGEAWEELAKTNPRIRAFLLKMISGGAWGALFMAHAPIFLAVVMKPAVMKRIPFNNLVGAFLTEDDGAPSEESQALGGLLPDDVQQMAEMANGLADQMGMPRMDFAQMARNMANGQRAPEPGGNQYAGFQAPPDGAGA
jgi:hypothetical protein